MKIIPADEISIPEHIRDAKDILWRKIWKRNPIYKKNYGGWLNAYVEMVNSQFLKSMHKQEWRE